MTSSIDIVPGDAPAWIEYLGASKPTLFQSWRWCRAVCDEYGFGYSALVVRRQSNIVGGLPFATIDDFRGVRRQSFAFSDICEPLGDVWRELEPWIASCGVPWTVRGRLPSASLAQSYNDEIRHHLLALDSLEDVRARYHATHRRFIAKAERSNLEIRVLDAEGGLGVFFPMFSQLRKSKFRLLPQGRRFFERVAAAYFPDRGCILAAFAGDEPIAAIVLLIEGETLYYKWGASVPDALGCRPNNLLFDRAVAWGIDRGLREFDLGISEAEGLIQFKQKLGEPRESTVIRARYNVAPRSTAVADVEGALGELTALLTAPDVPLQVVEEAGAQLYRFFV